ncbi:MAG: PAS domain S-box protein, partial [Victivallaceae bacterium]
AVEAIKLSREKYWSITRGIPDIVMRISRDGTYLECDTAIHDDLPLPPEQLIGKKIGELMPDALARQTLDCIAAAIDTGKTQTFEYELPAKDAIRHFEARLAAMNKNEVLCLVRNITAQKTAQAEIQNYKDFLDKIFDHMPIGIFTKALPDFRYNMCNKAAAAILSLPQEEILDKTDFDIFPKDVAKLCRMNDIDAILEDQIIDCEEVITDNNGLKKCLRTIKLPINRNNSKFLLEIAEDITDKKKIMDELKTSEEKYRSLIEAADDRIALFDLDGNILLANNAFYDTAGYSREEKSGKDYFKYVSPASENPFQSLIELLMAENMTSVEYKHPDKNGRELNMLAKFVLIKNSESKPYAMLGVIRDITELKNIHQRLVEAKEQAEKSDKLKSAFLANMSHEIRTPMSAIVGFANLLADPEASNQERLEYINIINQNSNELLDLITDIVDISKLESGLLETHKVWLSIPQVMDQLYERFSKLTRAEIKLRQSVPDGFEKTMIHTDENRFIQVFNNLLSNSLKFTAKGSIEFGFFPPENNEVKFFVKDTGTGIAPEFSNIIFEPFRQADDSYSRKFRGTGLGLSICMNLVKLLGGNIWFESDLGNGTTFFFTLPLPESRELPEYAPATQAADWVSENFTWSGKTVLIVDDNEICLRYLEAILQNTGFRLLRAESGIKAVMMCRENPDIDVVLMDIQMPGMNGLEATAEIKKIKANMPVIAQTAHALSNDRQNIMSAGCDEYITKPIKKLDLLKIIAAFVPPHSSRKTS